MSTILIKDALRQSVEAASGGAQTVLYTTKGQPTFMNIVEKYNLSTIDPNLSGTHPAFIVGGVEKDVLYIGTYNGVVKNGELLSLPNQDPSRSFGMTLDVMNGYAKANGAGHHIITNAEWSALALKAYANGFQPLGNSYYGQSAEDATKFGRRIDGKPAGAVTDINIEPAITLTGSGPVEWRHNGKYNGISDLSGNISEYALGVRLVRNELQVIANNDAAIASADLSETSTAWKAIDAVTGDLITPAGNGLTARSVKFASEGTIADYTLTIPTNQVFALLGNPSTTAPVSNVALSRLKTLALFPLVNTLGSFAGDTVRFTLSQDETLMTRGGYYTYGNGAGLFSYRLSDTRPTVGVMIGSRPAYYKP